MSVVEDLERLAKLKESGALTEEEFQKKKTELLSGDSKKPEKKKSKIRTVLTVIVALWIGWAIINAVSDNSAALHSYVTPESSFLNSEVLVRPGISDLGINAKQLVELMETVPLTSGGHQKINGWTDTDIGYRLHIAGQKNYYVDLAWSGESALMQPVKIGGKEMPAMVYMMAMSSSINK